MSQEIVHGQQNQILKVVRCRKKCPRATKPNFKSRPMSQKIVHGQPNQILKGRSTLQKIVHG